LENPRCYFASEFASLLQFGPVPLKANYTDSRFSSASWSDVDIRVIHRITSLTMGSAMAPIDPITTPPVVDTF
jgi:hypothetical protein